MERDELIDDSIPARTIECEVFGDGPQSQSFCVDDPTQEGIAVVCFDDGCWQWSDVGVYPTRRTALSAMQRHRAEHRREDEKAGSTPRWLLPHVRPAVVRTGAMKVDDADELARLRREIEALCEQADYANERGVWVWDIRRILGAEGGTRDA